MTDETDLVLERYARRAAAGKARLYSMLIAANWQTVQERQRALLRLFVRLGFDDLSSLRLVEVGAGSGGNLLELLRMGFAPELLSAIELIPERAAAARRVLPEALRVTVGNAAAASVPDESVDIVYQSVVFSSLLDEDFQAHLASRMWSWLRRGGGILWYDFAFNNPWNPDVRGVPLRRVRALFPNGNIRYRRITLAPPIARRVTALHPALYTVFNLVPLLRTHLLCWIQNPTLLM